MGVKVDLEKAFETTPLTNYYVIGDSIELDKSPVFVDKDSYNPAEDKLELRLFNIHWNARPTGYLGVNIGIPDTYVNLGFSNYVGSFNVQHSEVTEDGFLVHETTKASVYPGIENKAITRSTLRFNGDFLVSVKVLYPIYKLNETGQNYFTGEHETLCVKSIR